MAALGAAGLAAPAQGALSLTGPLNPITGFPAWYQDSDAVQLELCIADPLCPSAPPLTLTAPDGEAFYSIASATATGPGGQAVTIGFDLEAAFLDAALGSELTFGRVQVNMDGMAPNGAYTITHPYGSGVWTAEADGTLQGGRAAAQRHEVGCPGAPCNFDTALGTEIGPFLRWDPGVAPAAPVGYVGNGLTPHVAVGPADTSVTVTGPGLPGGGITTDLWTIEGKLAGPPTPIFSVAPGSGAFGTQRVGTSAERTVRIRNIGLAPMSLGDVALAGADAAEFTKGADGCAGQAIASGATCAVALSYHPTAAGARSAALVVAEAGAPAHQVALTGTGGLPGLSTSPAVVNFLNQRVGTTGSEQVLTVANTGNVPLSLAGAAIAGANAREFAVTTNTCTTIAAGGACTLGLKFLPAATRTRNAALTLTSDAPGGPHTVALTGNGTGSSLSLQRLRMATKIKRARARRQGLRVTMDVTRGTAVVKLNVYRRSAGKLTLISSGVRTRSKAGRYQARLDHLALRRQLRVGSYELQATPGFSRTNLGTTSKLRFRVVR